MSRTSITYTPSKDIKILAHHASSSSFITMVNAEHPYDIELMICFHDTADDFMRHKSSNLRRLINFRNELNSAIDAALKEAGYGR